MYNIYNHNWEFLGVLVYLHWSFLMDRLLTNTLNIVLFINAVFVMHWTFRIDTYTHFNLINYVPYNLSLF